MLGSVTLTGLDWSNHPNGLCWTATRYELQEKIPGFPEIVEEIANLLRNKDVQWGIENQTNGKRGDEIEGTINVPVGEATLTVETSDPNLKKDLDDLISRLEKVHDRTLDDHRRPLVPSWDNSLSDCCLSIPFIMVSLPFVD